MIQVFFFVKATYYNYMILLKIFLNLIYFATVIHITTHIIAIRVLLIII